MALLPLLPLTLWAGDSAKKKTTPTDREVWCGALYRMGAPVLESLSQGRLRQDLKLKAPNSDGRPGDVGYLECVGRLINGLAPWLTLPDDNTPEGLQRKQLREWALKGLRRAVDSADPDYMAWGKASQPLVDAAFLAQGFLRGYEALWLPLDSLTKARYIHEFTTLSRRVMPGYSNWLLFTSTIEAFLLKAGAPYDTYRLTMGIRKIEEWYVGDGMYSDGPHFAMDYYGSFVIQPMYVDVLRVMVDKKKARQSSLDQAIKRMQRYAILLERFISPEGTFPVFGRSITYRTGCLQPLSMLPLLGKLPKELPPGQVRAALTAVIRNMFADNRNFDEQGFLTLGFNGTQPAACDYYINTGSEYLASFGFVALGLPADNPFWTDEPQEWTSKKAWGGRDFPADHSWE